MKLKVKELIALLNETTTISVTQFDGRDTKVCVASVKLYKLASSVLYVISDMEIDKMFILNDVLNITVK